MKKVTILVGFGLLVLAYVGLSHAKENLINKSFQVSSGGTFTLDTDNGAIEVESHDQDTVEVLVKQKGRDSKQLDIEFSQDGDNVEVIGKKPSFSFMSFSGAKFIVKVPMNYNLDLRSSGGSIKVESLNGEVDAFTSGGSIRLGDIKGDVDIKTSGGSIRVDEVDGNIKAHTSGGSIDVKFASQPSNDSKLTTSGGSVTATLLPSIKVDLMASTSGGRVSSDFVVDGVTKKNKIDGEINGGGPRLTLKTSGGSVRVRKL